MVFRPVSTVILINMWARKTLINENQNWTVCRKLKVTAAQLFPQVQALYFYFSIVKPAKFTFQCSFFLILAETDVLWKMDMLININRTGITLPLEKKFKLIMFLKLQSTKIKNGQNMKNIWQYISYLWLFFINYTLKCYTHKFLNYINISYR